MTDIDALRGEWQALNDRVDALETSNERLMGKAQGVHRDKATTWFSVFLGGEALMIIVLILLTGAFIGNHFPDFEAIGFPVAFHLMLIATLIRQIVVAVKFSELNWEQPVVVMQQELLQLRRLTNLNSAAWLGFWLVMHMPFVFWLIYLATGYPVFQDPDSLIHEPWLISQWVFVVVAGAFLYWVFRFKADHPWVAALIQESGGLAINRVDQELRELAALSDDDAGPHLRG